MARYIDADMLRIEMEELYEHHIEMRNFSADGAVADCLTMLNNAPTADAAEVKHGEWIRHSPDVAAMRAFHKLGIGKGMGENSIFWTCSCCDSWGTLTQNYCSNCGAKMDGGKEE